MLLLALLFVLQARATAYGADRLRVVATTPDLGAIATAVGGDTVEATALARTTEDPHFVDAKPSHIVTLNRADALVEGGAAIEAGWLAPLVNGARNPRIAPGAPGRIVASRGIDLLDVPAALDRARGDVHPFGNPHYLLDPENGRIVAGTIAAGLCAIDPPHCESFTRGAERLRAAVAERLADWQALLAPAKGARLVAYHRTFDYLARRFGLEVTGYLEPKPGIPPSPGHLVTLIAAMQAAGVRVILLEAFRERTSAEFTAERTGARIVVLPIMPGGEVPDYVALLDHLVRKLAEACRP
jgi:ABC-type Zn uptake system ZnuABC Zn-binding protein ZnuA